MGMKKSLRSAAQYIGKVVRLQANRSVSASLFLSVVLLLSGCATAIHPVRISRLGARGIGEHQNNVAVIARALNDSLLADSSQGWLPLGRNDRPPSGEKVFLLRGSFIVSPGDSIRLDWRLVDPETSEVVTAESDVFALKDMGRLVAVIRRGIREYFQ